MKRRFVVRVSSNGEHSDFLNVTRQLPIQVRRGGPIDELWGWCDLPVRMSEVGRRIGGTKQQPIIGFEGSATAYELQVMMTWGSYTAMLAMNSEQDYVEGVGLRVALGLARENP